MAILRSSARSARQDSGTFRFSKWAGGGRVEVDTSPSDLRILRQILPCAADESA